MIRSNKFTVKWIVYEFLLMARLKLSARKNNTYNNNNNVLLLLVYYVLCIVMNYHIMYRRVPKLMRYNQNVTFYIPSSPTIIC